MLSPHKWCDPWAGHKEHITEKQKNSEFPFCLETTNLASPYLKTCATVKIWLNLMHINLISRLIHATVPVPGGGEWVVLGEKNIYQKCLECEFRLIRRPTKKFCFGESQSKGGGWSPDWDTIPNFSVFLVTPPLTSKHWALQIHTTSLVVCHRAWTIVSVCSCESRTNEMGRHYKIYVILHWAKIYSTLLTINYLH